MVPPMQTEPGARAAGRRMNSRTLTRRPVAWSGVLTSLRKLYLLMEPSDRRSAISLLLLMILSAALELVGVGAIPAFVSAVVDPDRLLGDSRLRPVLALLNIGTSEALILWSAIALILIFAIKNAVLIFNYRRQISFIAKQRRELSSRLIRAYMSAPYTFHLRHNTAGLIRNVDGEVSIICYQVMATFGEICVRVLVMLAVLAFLFTVEPWITLGWFLIFGSLAFAGVRTLSAKLRASGREEQEQRRMVVKHLNEGLGGIKEARVLGREAYFAERVAASVGRMAKLVSFKLFASKAIRPIVEFMAVAGLLAIAGVLVLLDRPAESMLVTLSLFVVALVRLRETISAAVSNFANFRHNIVAIDPVYHDLMALEGPARRAAPKAAAPADALRLIELKDVSYRYDLAPDFALRDISLRIDAGRAVAFVGSTGAGKSTLVDLMLGLLKPTRGQVFVNERDISAIATAWWHKKVGYVPQTIYLLDDTIRRNIALGLADHEIDEAALQAAIRHAQLDVFVARQPEGLDSIIGERGVRISGGERQRIGIARALYNDPELLIMDEATSSLDNATERAVIGAVEALKGQRTIIMIAHRLSTVRSCDQLFFLKNGRIEASGTFDELRESHEDFRSMSGV